MRGLAQAASAFANQDNLNRHSLGRWVEVLVPSFLPGDLRFTDWPGVVRHGNGQRSTAPDIDSHCLDPSEQTQARHGSKGR